MSKYINIPAHVSLRNPETSELLTNELPITFPRFVIGSIMSDRKWTSDIHWLRAANAVIDALNNANGVLELRNDEWDKLVEVAKAPSGGYQVYNPLVMPQLLPFIEAIVGASDKKPEGKHE